MDVGQVGFHNDKNVRYAMVEKKCNDIINRLNKTKVEREINYRSLREERDREERKKELEDSLKDEIKDRFGQPVKAREWFLVPLPVIDEVVEKIKDGTIGQYVYDPEQAALQR